MSDEKNVDDTVVTVPDSNPPEETVVTEEPVKTDEPDYKTKFSESSKEALRLLEETKAKDAEIERLRELAEKGANYSDDSDNLYPGFETLPEEEQRNLIAYTNSIKNKVKEELSSDPAFTHAKATYNETLWDKSFSEVSTLYPELKDNKDEFKAKYFRADSVPSNIGDILKDVAKIYLFDKAKDIGAKEAMEQANRIDIERQSGGDKQPVASRSLEDWQKLAESNPAEFAKRAKEYQADLESGKL